MQMTDLLTDLVLALEQAQKLDELSPAARAGAERFIAVTINRARAEHGKMLGGKAASPAPEHILSTACFGESAGMELKAWRLLGADLSPHLKRILAAQGEGYDRDLLRLQHLLTELRNMTPQT